MIRNPEPAQVASRASLLLRPGPTDIPSSTPRVREAAMFARSLPLVLFIAAFGPAARATAEEPTAREVKSHGYSQAIELKLGKTRAVLCPQAGGRVLEFSVDGTDAMYFDDAEKKWQPGKPGPVTAGRFDYGPELTVTPHPKEWAGEWTAEITKSQ